MEVAQNLPKLSLEFDDTFEKFKTQDGKISDEAKKKREKLKCNIFMQSLKEITFLKNKCINFEDYTNTVEVSNTLSKKLTQEERYEYDMRVISDAITALEKLIDIEILWEQQNDSENDILNDIKRDFLAHKKMLCGVVSKSFGSDNETNIIKLLNQLFVLHFEDANKYYIVDSNDINTQNIVHTLYKFNLVEFHPNNNMKVKLRRLN